MCAMSDKAMTPMLGAVQKLRNASMVGRSSEFCDQVLRKNQ